MMAAWGLVIAMCVTSAAPPAEAGGRCRPRVARAKAARANVVLQLDTGLTIVPFVATTQVLIIREPAFFYAYSTYAPPAASAAAPVPPANEAATNSPEASAENSVEPSAGLVVRSCARCHSGAAPEGGLSLSDLSQLSAADRLHAVARVVSDDEALRMPRGAKLSPAEIGAVVQELTRLP
jgi:mono/diheme cytochrome c family protein